MRRLLPLEATRGCDTVEAAASPYKAPVQSANVAFRCTIRTSTQIVQSRVAQLQEGGASICAQSRCVVFGSAATIASAPQRDRSALASTASAASAASARRDVCASFSSFVAAQLGAASSRATIATAREQRKRDRAMQALQDYHQRFNDLVSNDLPERKPIEALSDFDATCMKEGYLQKKGQRLKGWKRRWFVCDARTLSYYIHRKDRKPNAVIPLEGCTVQDGGQSETWNSPRIYLTDAASGVMYCLSSEDGDAVTQWLAVLRAAVARVNGSDGNDHPSSTDHPSAPTGAGPTSSRKNTRLDRNASARGASDDDDVVQRAKPRTALLKSASAVGSSLAGPSLNGTDVAARRTTRLVSGTGSVGPTGSASAIGPPRSHGYGKVQHLPTNIALENDLASGLDMLESLLCTNAPRHRSTSTVAFRPLVATGSLNSEVLKSVGTDVISGRVYARASVVLPVASEVAGFILADHGRRSLWDPHFPVAQHVASFDDATDVVHLTSGENGDRHDYSISGPQVAAAGGVMVAAGALLVPAVTTLSNALALPIAIAAAGVAGVAGSLATSVDVRTWCGPRDLLLLRHVRETSVFDKDHHSHDMRHVGDDESGQSIVLMLEKSVGNELKEPVAGVVRAHVGLSGWLLEPIDAAQTLATYVTDLDVGGWLAPALKRRFLIERLECVAVLAAYVQQLQRCGFARALGFDSNDMSDDDGDADENDGHVDDDGRTPGSTGRRQHDGAFDSDACFHPKSYMHSMVRTSTGGLKLIDKDVAKKQGGVLKEVIKSAGAKILEGKSAVSLSLPVRIFEPRTNLERVTDMFLYGPTFLNLAADQRDPVERLKFVVAFAVAGLHHAVGQLKPFNPILGETYQATLNDGTTVHCEHTSHHPPISNFQLVGTKYQVAGHVLWHGSFSMKSNALIQIQKGPIRISFLDGTVITYAMPHIQLGGFMWGDRTFDIMSSVVFEDATNHLAAEVKFNPDEKKGMGGMFSSSKTPTDSFRGAITDTTSGNEICELAGSWLDELKCGDRAYWTMGREKSGFLVPLDPTKVLASDSRNREDLKFLAAGDLDEAQEWKVKLEVLQRADRKIRNDGRRPNHWSLQDDKTGGGSGGNGGH